MKHRTDREGCVDGAEITRLDVSASITVAELHVTAETSMPISTDMIVRVAHADIAMHTAFPRSVRHWQRKNDREDAWKVLAGDCNAILIGKNDGVVIDGNCSNGVSAPDGGLVHIYGDLSSRIDIGGHYEIVITGNVDPAALIDASGFCHVFVGGRFSGKLRSSGSAKIWICNDFNGSIRTGTPSTEIYIAQNFDGRISSNETADLLFLTVAGFAPEASLMKIADCEYTQFHASIAKSDVPPGLYPLEGYHKKTPRGNSFARWCVESKNRK